MKKIMTLCIIHQHPKVLLGMKKRGFGVGRWNGFGGKVNEGETIEQADKFSGIPTESEEMKPEWFDIKEIPFSQMWTDDPFWMPLFLENKKFKGKFVFDENDNILEKELNEVENI